MEIPCCGFTCPVEATLRLVGGKYKAVILWHLMDASTLRYHELHRRIPRATDKMLAQQLRELERDGLLRRAVYPVVPPKTEYSLTDFGRSLAPILDCRAGWLAEWICEDFRAAEGDEKRLQREFHRHGPTALREVELGFDRAWSYSSGEYEGLILRNGNQVLRIEGNQIDLTGTKTLADIRTWLAEGA